jgi:hypothetical protein
LEEHLGSVQDESVFWIDYAKLMNTIEVEGLQPHTDTQSVPGTNVHFRKFIQVWKSKLLWEFL